MSTDIRDSIPRFTPEARRANRVEVDLLGPIAGRKKATPAQIALAWLPTPEQNPSSRHRSGRLDVHLRGGRVQCVRIPKLLAGAA